MIVVRQSTVRKKKTGRKNMTAFMAEYAEKQEAKKTGKSKMFKEVEEIDVIKFSPHGKYLACGPSDGLQNTRCQMNAPHCTARMLIPAQCHIIRLPRQFHLYLRPLRI